jgi:hypothetical protein
MADGQDQAIKVVIEVVDRFSKPLRDLKNQLDDMGKGGEKVGRATVQFEALRKSVADTAQNIKGLLVPSLNAIGISVLGVGAAFGAMTAGLRNFAQSTKDMIFLSRETGISIEKLKEFKAIGEAAGVSSEQMASSLNTFARNMQELRAGVGDTISNLRQYGDAGVRAFAETLRGVTDNAEAFERIVKFAQTMPRMVDRQKLFEMFGLPRDIARLLAQELDAARESARKYIPELTGPAQKSVKDFNDAIRDLRNAWEGIWADMANAGGLNIFTTTLQEWRNLLTSDTTKNAMKEFAENLSQFAQAIPGIVAGINSLVAAINKLVAAQGKFETPIQKAVPKGTWGDWWKSWKDWGTGTGGTITPPPMGEGSTIQKESFKQTIREGVVEGMTDAAYRFAGRSGGGFGGGEGRVIEAAYHPGGGFGGYYRGRGGGGGADYSGGPAVPAGDLKQFDYLREQRSGIASQLAANPNLKNRLAALVSLENPRAGVAVAESLFNRMQYVNEGRAKQGLPPLTLEQMMYGPGGGGRSFYGPIRRGLVGRRLAALMRNPEALESYKRMIDLALGGTNVAKGFTDQGSRGDPNYLAGGTGVNLYGERVNLWAGGPGGRAGALAFRERQQAAIQAELNRFKIDQTQAPAAKVEGSADLNINLNGFPKGTTTAFKTYGSLFGDVNLNRGNAAPEVAQ